MQAVERDFNLTVMVRKLAALLIAHDGGSDQCPGGSYERREPPTLSSSLVTGPAPAEAAAGAAGQHGLSRNVPPLET